jgi:predicted RNA-binding Zn ribbon-like protein
VTPSSEPLNEGLSRSQAPGDLEVVRALVNSIDLESGKDELTTPAELRRWLVERELLAESADVSSSDVASVVELREALRVLLLANNGEEVDDAPARAVLDDVAATGGVRVRFEGGGSARLETTVRGVDGAKAEIVVRVAAAMGNGTWSRLKACRADTCQWAFFDQSKNHSGAWCDMRVCGSRNKMRTYRSRKRAAPT